MGTNYDAIPYPEVRVHLGKQSAGWPFLFRAHGEWPKWDAKRAWLVVAESFPIEDEYGRTVTFDELMAKILTSYEASDRRHPDAFECEGWQFLRGEFC